MTSTLNPPGDYQEVDEDESTDMTWNDGTNGPLTGSFHRMKVRFSTMPTTNALVTKRPGLLLKRDNQSGTNNGECERKA